MNQERKRWKSIVLGAGAFFCSIVFANAATIYVNKNATGANNGSSWADAYTDLQPALAVAVAGDEVWVVQGTYYPTSGTDRNQTFTLPNNVGVYGGFVGTENNSWEHVYNPQLTILSGNIGAANTNTDNSYHVVTIPGGSGYSTLLSYFTVSDGNAIGDVTNGADGAGLLDAGVSFAYLENLVFSNNLAQSGGAIYDYEPRGTITSTLFKSNRAINYGGGLYIIGPNNPTFNSLAFEDNSAESAGAIYAYDFNGNLTTFNSCVFSKNHGDTHAGALWVDNPTVLNDCTFEGNYLSTGNYQGGAIYADFDLTINNSILYNNTVNGTTNLDTYSDIYLYATTLTINSSLIQSTYPCTNCLPVGTDPLFVNAADPDGPDNIMRNYDDGLVPCASSPVVDAGDNALVMESLDYIGVTRIQNGTVNLGAYENIPDPAYFTMFPNNASIASGTNTSFSVAANGTSFAWESSTDGITWTPVSGGIYSNETTTTLTLTNVSLAYNGYQYRCVASSCGSSVASSSALLTVSSPVMYVDHTASGANNGSSWADAYTTLETGLQNTSALTDSILVAAGTYYPTTGTDRNISFTLVEGVKLVGGYPNGGGTRDWIANPTILSGDIGVQGDSTDNTLNVVFSQFQTDATGIDGFIITKGFADVNIPGANFPHFTGGGMCIYVSSPTLSNLRFESNSSNQSGGGLSLYYSRSSLSDLSFYNNSCGYFGGALNLYGNSVHADGLVFENNHTEGYGGAISARAMDTLFLSNTTLRSNTTAAVASAIYSESSTFIGSKLLFEANHGNSGAMVYNGPKLDLSDVVFNANTTIDYCAGLQMNGDSAVIRNSVFTKNNAADYGGALRLDGSGHTDIINCTFEGNHINGGPEGAAIFIYGPSATIQNSIFANNSFGPSNITNIDGVDVLNYNATPVTFENSIIQSATSCTTCPVPNTDPMFTNAANPIGTDSIWGTSDDGLRICNSSAAINTGDNSFSAGILTDITGAPRIQNTTVDMGAYEGGVTGLQVAVNTQPAATSACSGTVASFATTAANAAAYQWQLSTNNGATWTNISGGIYSNETTATLSVNTLSATENGNQYRCVVAGGPCGGMDTTNAAALTVNSSPLVAVSTQPAATSTCSGTAASFATTATNAAAYQWQLSTNNGITWANISGGIYSNETTATLSMNNLTVTENGNQYRCVLTGGTCGGMDTTDAAVLTVNAAPVVTVTQNDILLTADATGASYQWLDCDNGNAPLNGETNQVFAATVNGNYAVIVTQNGCSDTSTCVAVTTVGLAKINVSSEFNVYPNPAVSEINIVIDANTSEVATLVITDAQGKEVMSTSLALTAGRNTSNYKTDTFARGIYFVKVIGKDNVLIKKIVLN